MYGARCTVEQLKDVPRMTVILNVVPIIVLALISGQWFALSLWLPTCFAVNIAYNMEPLRLSSKGPFELPCVVAGFAGVTALGSIVNNIPWAPVGYWVHMSCLVLRTQIWTEFLDYDPDLACGRRTTSTMIGKDLSKAAVVILLALEGLVTWYFFEDFLMRLFSILGMVFFIVLEIIRGTDDRVSQDYRQVVAELRRRHVEVELRTTESMWGSCGFFRKPLGELMPVKPG
eukprot:symbB.v1.2.001404.t2/scaffold75.1/size348941/10